MYVQLQCTPKNLRIVNKKNKKNTLCDSTHTDTDIDSDTNTDIDTYTDIDTNTDIDTYTDIDTIH